jgi:hypothetical protein
VGWSLLVVIYLQLFLVDRGEVQQLGSADVAHESHVDGHVVHASHSGTRLIAVPIMPTGI